MKTLTYFEWFLVMKPDHVALVEGVNKEDVQARLPALGMDVDDWDVLFTVHPSRLHLALNLGRHHYVFPAGATQSLPPAELNGLGWVKKLTQRS